MTVTKTALAASVILTTLGLAGCQTTEERVYYSSAPPPVSRTYVYQDGPRWRAPPPRVYVASPPSVYYGYGYDRPRRIEPRPPRFYGGPTPDPRHPPHITGGPTPDPRWDRRRGQQPGVRPFSEADDSNKRP